MKMTLENIKTPEDILQFMRDNIIYAWLDDKKQPHINNNKDGRKLYRTFSVEEALEYKFGTCIEQVSMMSMLLDKLNIPNKMYCIRIYDGKDWKLYAKGEFVHCFVLY